MLLPRHFERAIQALNPPRPFIPVDTSEKEETLRDILRSFKVRAEVVGTSIGPRITRFEVRPRMGVSVKSITKLDADIQRIMSARSVRMEAPVPGTDFVGIEIPNEKAHPVFLRELVNTPTFREATSKLFFAVGKAVDGTPVYADLAKLPHLLIAGSTNSGKSVFLNSLITSLIMRARPYELKFTMIDPKKVELTMYNGIPHLKERVITTPEKAINALYNAVVDMKNRFKMLEAAGVRNIETYNQKYPKAKLYYHVIIIDELADLMMEAGQEVETYLTRLAQLARAVGIHLVIATQRPSVKVITGAIKANFPARLAFSLPSAVDSRTILDSGGAESLLGSGDMLFSNGDIEGPKRIQSAYLSEEEVNNIVKVTSSKY